MGFNAKQWAGIALAALALGFSIWSVALIVILIAHAVGMFVKAVILAALAGVFGFSGFALFSKASFDQLWKIWN